MGSRWNQAERTGGTEGMYDQHQADNEESRMKKLRRSGRRCNPPDSLRLD